MGVQVILSSELTYWQVSLYYLEKNYPYVVLCNDCALYNKLEASVCCNGKCPHDYQLN